MQPADEQPNDFERAVLAAVTNSAKDIIKSAQQSKPSWDAKVTRLCEKIDDR